jgi:hypothetical protein
MDEKSLRLGVVRRVVSAALVFVAVPTLGIVLPEPEYCTAPPGSVMEGQMLRCPKPPPLRPREILLENRVTPEAFAR